MIRELNMKKGLRWAVSLEETGTSSGFENTFRRAVLCASESDVEQQRRFRFKEDALACLIGRLMPRRAAVLQMPSSSWSSLEFVRNEKGKPSIRQSAQFEYNIAHHGDLVVLATGETRIGVDVMRIEEDRRATAAEQMDTLRRHFSAEETETVKGKESETERWRAFFRIWCLKESILKATGVGLPDGLHNHTFHLNDDCVPGNLITSTEYFHRLISQPQWRFEESFIGQNHCVAVASESFSEAVPFEMITLESILKNAEFVNVTADVDEELDAFMEKPNKPF